MPAATEATRTTGIAIVSSPAIGDSSRLGETAEVEVTYSEAVTVRGTPLVGLSVGSATGDSDNVYNAAYTITQIKRYGGRLGHRDSRIGEKSW